MMAKVGENHRGQFIINDFRYNGVDTSAIIVDAPGTSSPFCLSLSEEEHKTRIFIGKEGTAGELLPEEIDYEYLGKAKYLHLENGRPASATAALFAREHGIVTVMDADNYQEGIVKLLPCLDVFIASEFFYRDMFGDLPYEEGCRKLLEAGPSTAIVTLGSRGSVGMTAQDGFFGRKASRCRSGYHGRRGCFSWSLYRGAAGRDGRAGMRQVCQRGFRHKMHLLRRKNRDSKPGYGAKVPGNRRNRPDGGTAQTGLLQKQFINGGRVHTRHAVLRQNGGLFYGNGVIR